MSDAFAPVTPAAIEWRDDGPWATDFGDGYFSRQGAVAESDHVFIHGNDLPARFAALPAHGAFTLGETGFGTGLNFLRAVHHFLLHAPAGARLHYVSTERHPLRREDLRRALEGWTRDPLIEALVAAWPAPVPGFHRLTLADGRVRLTLLFGDARRLLALLDARVDAWFLDGFAPARNPAMWSDELFAELARLSAPGATLATFTAAGFVRRGLQAQGFHMRRAAGFGSKRDMLVGELAGDDGGPAGGAVAPVSRPAPAIAVVGAGLAGCTVARALAERGAEVTLFDAAGIAAGASGNLAGVVYTTPSAHPTPQNRFYQTSFMQALAWLRCHDFPATPEDGALSGVCQLARDPRQARRARDALASGLWPAELVRPAPDAGPDALWFPSGGYLSPARWCRHLAAHARIRLRIARVTGLTPVDGGWDVDTGPGRERFDQVVLANAAAALTLHPLPWVRPKSIRGQVTHVRATAASARWPHAWCHAGYLTPAIGGLHCVGATFDQGDDDDTLRADDHARNLAQLREWLPTPWQELGGDAAEVTGGRTGFRCQSRDFLPLAGPVPEAPGLWLDIAHGSRGITGTPLCAELIASAIFDEPCPVDRPMRQALAPVRFRDRDTPAPRGVHT